MSEPQLTPLRIVQSGLCIGCGACVSSIGPENVSMDFDNFGQLRPFGPPLWMNAPDERFDSVCPFSPTALDENEIAAELFPNAPVYETSGRFVGAYVGACVGGGFRDRGSSGGMVSWTLEELLQKGWVDGVIHVVPIADAGPRGRLFDYRISRTAAEIREGAKSRYYPVEMSRVIDLVSHQPGRYAIVGVPCFIKAIQLLRRQDPLLRERISYTLGLFCGHMKSAQFAESLAAQMGVDRSEIAAIEFRIKDESRPASTYTAQVALTDGSHRTRDWWNMVDGDWGSGFFQYSACNFCDDVIAETADISFGDAWVEPYSSDGRGTNVIVIRSAEIHELVTSAIAEGRLKLEGVDEAFIVATQAAGFRQRREGLSYRMTWPKRGVRPRKRFLPLIPDSKRRRLIYRTRASISYGSHRIFFLSKRLRWLPLFVGWGRISVAFYHGFAYSRGKIGKVSERLGLR